jgi:hypothetical protein
MRKAYNYDWNSKFFGLSWVLSKIHKKILYYCFPSHSIDLEKSGIWMDRGMWSEFLGVKEKT